MIEIVNIPDMPSEEVDFNVDFKELKKINSDIVGWIVIEGTQVNYPIVQGKNNSYYLNHAYDKKYSSLGSIFMDYASTSNFTDENTFIYGHHTQNGSMFGEIKKYMDVNFYNEHPSFYLYTPEGNYRVDIISVYVADALSDSYNQVFTTKEEFKKYLDNVIEKSIYSTNVTIDYEIDRIITLYSCSHEYNRKKYDRYFIHGKVIDLNE